MNQAITSREYKLMLNVDRFKDRGESAQAFWGLVEFLARQSGGQITKRQDEEENRRTMYLDTARKDLSQRGFILRLRQEKSEEYKLTLKYRDPDRYVSAGQDLSSPEPDKKTKFEEDIMPPFISKFSHSTAITQPERPQLNKMERAVKFFEGLKALNIPGETPLEIINGFEAYEVFRKIGQITFGDELVIKASLSFWYWLAEGEGVPPSGRFPLVVEFSFDYDLEDKTDKLENYPSGAVAKINRFFEAVQKQSGWVDLNGTTKTAFAYGGL